MMMRVSASMVLYRTDMAEVLQCMTCLVENGVTDIWVIDNSPEMTDVASAIARRWNLRCIKLRYRHLPNNPGYGTAHNMAIHCAYAERFEAHIVLNTDIRFGRGVVDRMIEVLLTDSRIGQISPQIVYPDGTEQYVQRLLPTPIDVFGRRFLPSFMKRSRNHRYVLAERDPHLSANIPYHQGSFMMFRMRALGEIGGFDERFFMYPEDIDITRRMHRKYITLYYPHVTVVHDHRASSYKSLRMLWVHCLNMIRYFNKWGWWYDPERRRVNRDTLRAMGLDRHGRRQSPQPEYRENDFHTYD